jgi:hypothetical protein
MKLHLIGIGLLGLLLILSGCSASYRIQVIDELANEVYLNYSKGADVEVGDIFILYQYHPAPPSGGHQGHRGGSQLVMKHEIARVQDVSIVDELHAAVKVLSGQIVDGLEAEKLE